MRALPGLVLLALAVSPALAVDDNRPAEPQKEKKWYERYPYCKACAKTYPRPTTRRYSAYRSLRYFRPAYFGMYSGAGNSFYGAGIGYRGYYQYDLYPGSAYGFRLYGTPSSLNGMGIFRVSPYRVYYPIRYGMYGYGGGFGFRGRRGRRY